MTSARRRTKHCFGFTLFEMLVATAASTSLLATIMLSSVTLQRSFYWSSEYAVEANAQLRAVDYVTRDLRGAISVTIPTGGQILSMDVPDYYSSYDAQGNPTSAPVDPVVIRGMPEYGDPALPVSVTYFLNGDALLRQQIVQATGQTTSVVVARNLSDFTATLVGQGVAVRFDLTFARRNLSGSSGTPAGTVGATVAARGLRLKSMLVP